jgi:glycosyltransferase involved in cell wall biosynthesis
VRILVSHPTGNEFFREAINGFYSAGCLHAIYTSVASFPGTLSHRLGSVKKLSDIRRRTLPAAFKKITHTHPVKEWGRLLAVKAGKKKLVQHEMGIFSADAVYKSLDKYVAKNLAKEKQQGVTAIYAYEDGAYHSFRKAVELNMQRLYDLPIGHWRYMRSLLKEEKELNPGWANTLEGLKDSAEKLERKDEEIALADKIFVASSFTMNSLKAYPGTLAPVSVIPYGFPPATEKNYRNIGPSQKIKLLFVGGLSQRKGLSYLFKAVEGLDANLELTVVGRLPQISCAPLHRELCKHKHISSLPHEKILRLMHEQDVLIFPSLFEGFGQVITEAMAQGTPVITTERTAGADVIQHGENGWLVKAGSAEAIKNVLQEITNKPGLIEQAGRKALDTAKKRPWSVYRKELVEAVLI